jgi:hypothetical protein
MSAAKPSATSLMCARPQGPPLPPTWCIRKVFLQHNGTSIYMPPRLESGDEDLRQCSWEPHLPCCVFCGKVHGWAWRCEPFHATLLVHAKYKLDRKL